MKKTFVVTGISSGIGLSLTKELLKKNHIVIGTYLSNNSNIKKIKNKNLKIFNLDISLDSEIHKFCKSIKKNKIDGIVNNAGMNLPSSFNNIDQDSWKKVNDANLYGPFKLTQMLEKNLNKKSSIVNVSSFSGQIGGPISTHYAVAKAGVISLTQNMAIYFSKNKTRVNCVSPGLIDTKMASNAKDHPLFKNVILSRVGKPLEVAKVISFLLSDESSYITGQTINVNGGMFF